MFLVLLLQDNLQIKNTFLKSTFHLICGYLLYHRTEASKYNLLSTHCRNLWLEMTWDVDQP